MDELIGIRILLILIIGAINPGEVGDFRMQLGLCASPLVDVLDDICVDGENESILRMSNERTLEGALFEA